MTAFDDPEARTINTDALINMIYDIQTSLKMLADQLARDRNSDCSNITLWSIQAIHHQMQRRTPSLRRH